MIRVDIEALERKYARYPNILKFIELQMYLQNEELLSILTRLTERDLRKGRMGGDCKSFKDLDRFCEVVLMKVNEISQNDSD